MPKSKRSQLKESKKSKSKAKQRVGLPPGTLLYLGNKISEGVQVELFDYNSENFEELQLQELHECASYKDKASVTWVNVDGLHEIETLRSLGNLFGIHTLCLEDILNTSHRPKLDDFDDHLFIIAKMIYLDSSSEEIRCEHFCMVVGKGYVLTFQEMDGDVFQPLRERIRFGRGRVRKLKSDYLAYAFLDTIVDNYFVVLERLEERIEPLEIELLNNPTADSLSKIHALKQEAMLLRKALWPLREVVATLIKGESGLIQEETIIFLRDLQDHILQALDATETARDVLSSMTDLYMSSVSHRLNETMKVLTVMASVFIPLTFIAGIYGMNFEVMPELHWKYGYAFVWLLMVIVATLTLFILKRKKWL